jgi:hypothetical protein
LFAGSSIDIPALAKMSRNLGVHGPPRAVDLSLQMVAMWCVSTQGPAPPLPLAPIVIAVAATVTLTPSAVSASSSTLPNAGSKILSLPSACMAA